MVRDIFIHLGDMKTGSTALQSVLRFGEYELPGVSICYPGKNLHHNNLATPIRTNANPDLIASRMRAIGDELRQSDADIGVVSAEFFEFVPAERLQGLIAEFWPDMQDKIRLVAYVRPHVEKLLALYSTHMRFGSRVKGPQTEFERASKGKVLDYCARFEAWRECFGDRFILRPFIRSELHNQDVVQDFFHVMTGETVRLTGEPIANASLKVGQIALLRHYLEPFHAEKDRPQAKIDSCASLCRLVARRLEYAGLGKETPKLTFPEPAFDRFVKRYQDDARALDAAFFENQVMENALLQAPGKYVGPRQSLEARSYFSKETLDGFGLLAELQQRLTDEDPEHMQRSTLKLLHRDWGTE